MNVVIDDFLNLITNEFIDLNLDELGPIKKQYKKLKKYMKSSIYEVRMMNGTEKTITNLLKENENVTENT